MLRGHGGDGAAPIDHRHEQHDLGAGLPHHLRGLEHRHAAGHRVLGDDHLVAGLEGTGQTTAATVVLLAGAQDGKAALVAGVNGSATGRVKADELLAHVAGRIGGKGGGRPDLAQGGGEDGPALALALDEVPAWVGQRLQ